MLAKENSQTNQRTSKVPRVLLFSLFIVMMIDNIPGMGIGIGLGLSAKNLYLYLLVLMVAVKAATGPMGIRFVDLDIHWPFLLLILYSMLTWVVLGAFDPTYASLRGAITMKNQLIDHYLLILVFVYGVSTRRDYMWLLRAVVTTMFILSFITLIDFLNIPDLGIIGTYKGRIEGPFGAANQYGALLAFLLPVSIALMPRNGRLVRALWFSGIVVTGILLIATGSRGAYFATVIGSLFAVIYLRRYVDIRVVAKYSALAAIVLILILVVFAFANPEFLLERFEKTTTGGVQRASSGRVQIWTAALLVMVEWPFSFVVGYGWNAYESSGIWKSAHNEYLSRLYELGAIGVVLFIAVLRAVPARVRRAIGNADPELARIYLGYVIGMTIILVDIIFVAIPEPWAIVWIISATMIGLTKVSLTRESRSEPSSSSSSDSANVDSDADSRVVD